LIPFSCLCLLKTGLGVDFHAIEEQKGQQNVVPTGIEPVTVALLEQCSTN
jgi:hypothetical protein